MKDENLGKRLAYWAHQLRCNKSYPWVGTGLIDDLEQAALAQGADLFTELVAPEIKYNPKIVIDPKVKEYDL